MSRTSELQVYSVLCSHGDSWILLMHYSWDKGSVLRLIAPCWSPTSLHDPNHCSFYCNLLPPPWSLLYKPCTHFHALRLLETQARKWFCLALCHRANPELIICKRGKVDTNKKKISSSPKNERQLLLENIPVSYPIIQNCPLRHSRRIHDRDFVFFTTWDRVCFP